MEPLVLTVHVVGFRVEARRVAEGRWSRLRSLRTRLTGRLFDGRLSGSATRLRGGRHEVIVDPLGALDRMSATSLQMRLKLMKERERALRDPSARRQAIAEAEVGRAVLDAAAGAG